MLPAPLRMRRSAEFQRTIRRGARAGRDTVVVHCVLDPEAPGRQVGFVVARSVGNAVVRNRVRRRLRGVVIELTEAVPEGAAVVVRALPAAATAEYASLRDDVRSALGSAVRRSSRASSGRAAGGRP